MDNLELNENNKELERINALRLADEEQEHKLYLARVRRMAHARSLRKFRKINNLLERKIRNTCRYPSSLARKFNQNGVDWMTLFAKAILNDNKEKIQLWLKLLPYLMADGKKAIRGVPKTRATLAAKQALEQMERDARE